MTETYVSVFDSGLVLGVDTENYVVTLNTGLDVEETRQFESREEMDRAITAMVARLSMIRKRKKETPRRAISRFASAVSNDI